MELGKLENKSLGHRERLRQRFLQSGFDGFLDYEIIELLLTLGTPRKDCKNMAKDVIAKFGGLKKTLDAEISELQMIDGIGPSNAFGFKLFQAVAERIEKDRLDETMALDSPESIFWYLREKIGKEKKEHFIILCLDARNKIIFKDISIGILNASLVHPREVFNEAVKVHAAKIVIAHNHPSGDPTPSDDDVLTAKRLVEAGKIIGVAVLDSLVISRDGYVSMREKKLFQFF